LSRVHLNYVIKEDASSITILDVLSPDFSKKGVEIEIIGQLKLDYKTCEFKFIPASTLSSTFCPPEYFENYSGDIDKVDMVCKEEGLMCTAWSYRIYKKAIQVLESRER